MYNEKYFTERVSTFYRELDRGIRTLGSEKLGSQDIYYRLSRFATPTVEYSEIKRVCADIDAIAMGPNEPSGHARWPYAWGRASKRYKDFAEKAESTGFNITAGMNYLRASLLAHAGQMMCRPEWPEKIELQKERAYCYRRAALYLGIEEHYVPYGKHKLPAYLWIPASKKPVPVVVMAPGADSTKEELHRWAQAFVARGLAAMTFDGPGQGELTPLLDRSIPMRLETYHEAFTAVINYLQENASDRVDTSRIAIWGQSMGGHVVFRAFEHEKRPIAVVDVSCPPNMDIYPFMAADTQERIRDLFGFTTFEETWEYCQVEGNVIPHATIIKIPCLIIHGSRDPLVSDDTIAKLASAIGSKADVFTYRDGNHGVFNWDFFMTDSMADWLVEKLVKA